MAAQILSRDDKRLSIRRCLKFAVCAVINTVNQKASASASAVFNYFANEETDVARLIMVALTKHWKRPHCGVGWTLVLWVLRVLRPIHT